MQKNSYLCAAKRKDLPTSAKEVASFCRVQLNLMQWQADRCIYRYHESRTTRAGFSQTPRTD